MTDEQFDRVALKILAALIVRAGPPGDDVDQIRALLDRVIVIARLFVERVEQEHPRLEGARRQAEAIARHLKDRQHH